MHDVELERVLFVRGPHKGMLGFIRQFRDYQWSAFDFDGNLLHECNAWSSQLPYEEFEAAEEKWAEEHQFVYIKFDGESERVVSEIQSGLWRTSNKEQPATMMTPETFHETLGEIMRDQQDEQ